MNDRMLRPALLAVLLLGLTTHLVKAGFVPSAGYSSTEIMQTDSFSPNIEGLDYANGEAIIGLGTNIWSINLDTGATNALGTVPVLSSIAYVLEREGEVLTSFAESPNFIVPYRFGHLDSGVFQDEGSLGNMYDAALDSSNKLFLVANPNGLGTKVFCYDAAVTAMIEVIHIGGYSGGIAFDSQDRLYVADQNGSGILRYTPSQLDLGGLTVADGTSVVAVTASQLCFDEHDRLYAAYSGGNSLGQFDIETGSLLRTIGIDDANGYGLWRTRWDDVHKQILLIYTDFFVESNSRLFTVGFTDSNEGVSHASPFQGWIAAYRNFIRPNTNSGGYARNNANAPATPGEAIVGKPAGFETGVEASGHVLSLGNGGSIVLEFEDIIVNGPGPDFAVFENAFYAGGTFSEFAFVEVASTTGVWARFPVTCYNTNAVGPFDVQDVTKVDGLAGKHEIEYGTPFDLEWLKNDTNVLSGSVDLDQVAYIRLTDAVGDGSTTDQFGRPIYDPYDGGKTNLTDGFDLRGIGVLHHAGLKMAVEPGGYEMQWYGYPGRAYQPKRSDDGIAWENVGGMIVGTGGVHRVALPQDHESVMFRVEQEVVAAP